MNKYDSETISGYLEKEGYKPSEEVGDSDLVIVNTCSIREKAEDKVYSQIGRLNKLKKKNPNLKIAVCGCFANRAGEEIAKKAQSVDLIFGTQNIAKLPDLLEQMEEGRVVDTEAIVPDFISLEPMNRENGKVVGLVLLEDVTISVHSVWYRILAVQNGASQVIL